MQTTQRLSLLAISCLTLTLFHTRLEAHLRYVEKGLASWYGKAFAGRQTASGDTFFPQEMTAAHRTLPLGTKVIVKNLETGEQAEVKITDRGPYADTKRRIIDLSHAAADSIGLVERGVGAVQVAVTEPPASTTQTPHEEVFSVVQVGAFEEYTEARWILEQFQDRYAHTYIDPRQGPAGPYYRVRIGPFAAPEKAARIARTLRREGHAIFVDAIPATTGVKQVRQAKQE
jgi:rare lipoprotein A